MGEVLALVALLSGITLYPEFFGRYGLLRKTVISLQLGALVPRVFLGLPLLLSSWFRPLARLQLHHTLSAGTSLLFTLPLDALRPRPIRLLPTLEHTALFCPAGPRP